MRGASLHRLVEGRVLSHPDARALVCNDVTLSYAELNARANQLAHQLVQCGMGPEVVAGVYMERGLDLVVALLAVLKAGGAYLPLDPNYPADRIALMLEDCRTSVLISNGSVDVPFAGARIDLTADARAIAANPSTNLSCDVDPENLAYVIYTSGSTGQPKGVLVPHGCVTRLMSATEAWFQFTASDVWTFFHSHAFDFSVWEIWGALIYGGAVVVVPDRVRRSPDELLELLASQRVTVLNQIPSAFRDLVASATRTAKRTPLALRLVIFGGEALDLASLAPWFERYPDGPRLVNMYGITETTVHVTYRPIDPTECKTTRGSPIGVAIPDLELHLLDAALCPVREGEEGEIYVGGAGLARGYQRRAALTAERFVPNPFSRRAGARLYKTGDVARQLPDGSIDYLGRNDGQVKVRGYRIETGEIAATLRAHPAVRDAVVIACDVDDGDRRLIAYVVPAQDAPLASDVLRDYLVAKLPRHMIPSGFVGIDAMPLAPSGKLDVKALPAPAWSVPSSGEHRVAPRTGEEQTIANVWATALRVESVGLQDDFFELGGHSLLAIKVVAKICSAFDVELTLGHFFGAPTVEGIAAEVVRLRGRSSEQTRSIPVVPRDQLLRMSNAQERMWFVERMLRADGPRPFNVSIAIGMRGELDAAVLATCLTEVIARHEILRTNFRMVGRNLIQVVAPPFSIELAITSAGPLEGQARTDRIQQLARAHTCPAFDLANGRLIRAKLIELAPHDHVLLLSVHHIVYDGASVGVLVRELAALYESFRAGQPSPLAPPRVQYADIAQWQRQAVANEELDRQLAFWSEQLATAPIVDLPSDFARPPFVELVGAHVNVQIPPAITTAARELARHEGVTLFITLVAALAAQLAQRTGETDLVIGTALSMRTRPELESAIGLFLNMVALRLDVAGDPTFRELVHRARAVVVDAFKHHDVPFEKVVAALKRAPDPSRGALFQVTLTLNHMPAPHAPEGQTWEIDFPDTGSVLDDLTLEVNDNDVELSVSFAYRTDLFERRTIEKLAEDFAMTLRRGIELPDRPLALHERS